MGQIFQIRYFVNSLLMKLVRGLLSLLLMWGTSWGTAYSQGQYWARHAGGATTDEATDISVDGSGNTYTTGYFTAAASFGTITLSSLGVTDVFISKTDPSGFFEWAIKAGGSASDRALSIKTDAAGNSYITGFFYGTATFGTQTLTSAGVQDVFVAKYDNTGAFVWATSAGGSGSDIGNAVNVDNSGNVVITGEFAGTATFGSTTLTSLGGSVDVFTAKLDASGNFLWAKKGSAHATDRGIDVACDPSGNVYITGQFTDTITFDNTYQTNMFNAIFVVKYNANGVEQWFRRAGAASLNLVNGIAVDASSNVFITGDFEGDLTFFGSPNSTLTHPYPHRVFVAKYNSSGSLLWSTADGSDGEITSRNLALDSSGNPFIVGNFKCRLGSFSDQYGDGTFNSVGYWDIFMANYSASGQWQWARSLGGRQDDFGNGITVDPQGEPIVAGTFLQTINLPVPDDFEFHETDSVSVGAAYCGDDNYRNFRDLTSNGSIDMVIAKIFDTDREPYDYYRRSAGCDRSFVGVCAGGQSCPDSLTFCAHGTITSYSNIVSANVGPSFTYQWSTGSGAPSISVSQSGYYTVTQTSADGCFVSEDSIYVHINPSPPKPLISDDIVVNVEALNPEDVYVCAPDSVQLTATGFGNYEPNWSGPVAAQASTVWATQSGYYSFYYFDDNGCLAANTILVEVDEQFDTIDPVMVCLTDEDLNDTVSFCTGLEFTMFIYDSIANPEGELDCIHDAVILWSVTPGTIDYDPSTSCGNSSAPLTNIFIPEESGEYLVEAQIIRVNHCDTAIDYISRSIYVELYPLPISGPLSIDLMGVDHICPGDSTQLTASLAPNYLWSGPQGEVDTTESIWVSQAGMYTVATSVTDTNEYGCFVNASASDSIMVIVQSQPLIVPSPGNAVICPNHEVVLQCDGSGTFEWQGPSGPIGGNQSSVNVSSPGIYYCIRLDQYGCELVSNSIEVDQYATPELNVAGAPILCDGETITISASTTSGSTLVWQSPLSGSEPEQIISQPGVYTCVISACGIETEASITVVASEVEASISVVGPSTVCEGDSVILQANEGQSSYVWTPSDFQDTILVVFESGTYTLTTMDENGCTKVSTPVNVTIVENNLQPPFVNDTAICPDGYAILKTVSNSTVYWYDEATSEVPIEVGPVYTTPSLNTNTTYYVQQKNAYCESDKTSVVVEMDDCEGIETPSVFSPNGDGINDVFYFPQKGGTCFNCRIYNRWGRLLYEWADQNQGWDGTIQRTGAKVQDGVYYYLLDYCDYQEQPFQKAGFLEVLGSR